MTINVKTARALGLDIPPTLLARAGKPQSKHAVDEEEVEAAPRSSRVPDGFVGIAGAARRL